MPGLYACGEMLGSLCAAIAAREAGADVCLLEWAPEALRGGNSAFTADLMRTVYDDVGDVLRLVDSLTDEDLARTDFGSYTAGDFLDTLARITEYRCDPELASQLVGSSTETLEWLSSHGVRPTAGRRSGRATGSGSGAGRSSRWSGAAGAGPTASKVLAGTRATSFITLAGNKVPVVDPLDAVPFPWPAFSLRTTMTTTMATTDDRAAREQDLATALGPPGGRLLRGDPLPDLLLPVPG